MYKMTVGEPIYLYLRRIFNSLM